MPLVVVVDGFVDKNYFVYYLYFDFVFVLFLVPLVPGFSVEIVGCYGFWLFRKVNLDVKKPLVRYTLTENTKKLDKNSYLIMTGSKTTINNRIAKRGGVFTWTRGNWSGRIIDGGNDSLGRWTYITMAGKSNQKLTIYTLYRVCDQKHNSGDCTIFM